MWEYLGAGRRELHYVLQLPVFSLWVLWWQRFCWQSIKINDAACLENDLPSYFLLQVSYQHLTSLINKVCLIIRQHPGICLQMGDTCIQGRSSFGFLAQQSFLILFSLQLLLPFQVEIENFNSTKDFPVRRIHVEPKTSENCVEEVSFFRKKQQQKFIITQNFSKGSSTHEDGR